MSIFNSQCVHDSHIQESIVGSNNKIPLFIVKIQITRLPPHSEIQLLGKYNDEDYQEKDVFYIWTTKLIGRISINTTINTVLHRFVSIYKHWQYLRIWDGADIELQKKNLCGLSSQTKSHTHTHTYCHPLSISSQADNGSWAQCARVECVVWPSTQMSMFHCGEWRERGRETKRVKWNLTVFVNHRENAVCVCQRKRERR